MPIGIAKPAARLARLALPAFIAAGSVALLGQDRLKTMPGYDQFQKMSKEIAGAVTPGVVVATWSEDGKSFEYTKDRKIYRFDLATRKSAEIGDAPEPADRSAGGGRGAQGTGPARGRQFTSAESPDKALKAVYRDRNLFLSDASGGNEAPITTDGKGNPERIKYGTASWVYGEELDQTTAIWWSPDSRKVAYYRFDESQVPDYTLQVEQTRLYSRTDSEAYPKAGQPNPIVDLFVYDVASKKSVRIDVRDGRPFDNTVVGHYVYRVAWAPDGRELLFHRTNRRQNILEFVAANPDTGACRVIIREEWPSGWIENTPTLIYLKDGKRFIWASERTGWRNYYLYDLSGRQLSAITNYTTFEAGDILKVDEAKGVVFLMARDGENPLKMQLHRVGLDGRGDLRLTDAAYTHSVGGCLERPAGAAGRGGRGGAGACGISTDNRFFVDVYQTHDTPPATRLVDATTARPIVELAASDLTKFKSAGFRPAEMFTYLAADGRTKLRGLISFPSGFDPSKKYPALVSVYGGPTSASNTATESFVSPRPLAEFGFLVVNLDSRAIPGLGKRTLDSLYLKLGEVEIDDMAEGVKALWNRPYFDRDRVGIYGTSYGGYAAIMCLLRHPEAFRAAAASSPPTAWYNYDTIYTERYMWIPEENKAGYETGSAMKYADPNLGKPFGRLLIYYGTADNNVHPTNSLQLIQALQRAGRSFEVQVGPDAGHSPVNQQRMMEFFIENLVVNAR